MNCISCESIGTKTLCDFCTKHATQGLKRRAIQLWHETVCTSSKCYHCERYFPVDMICGDHFITKGSRPDLKYDIRNGVPTCQECNTSGSKYRKQPTIEFIAQFSS